MWHKRADGDELIGLLLCHNSQKDIVNGALTLIFPSSTLHCPIHASFVSIDVTCQFKLLDSFLLTTTSIIL